MPPIHPEFTPSSETDEMRRRFFRTERAYNIAKEIYSGLICVGIFYLVGLFIIFIMLVTSQAPVVLMISYLAGGIFVGVTVWGTRSTKNEYFRERKKLFDELQEKELDDFIKSAEMFDFVSWDGGYGTRSVREDLVDMGFEEDGYIQTQFSDSLFKKSRNSQLAAEYVHFNFSVFYIMAKNTVDAIKKYEHTGITHKDIGRIHLYMQFIGDRALRQANELCGKFQYYTENHLILLPTAPPMTAWTLKRIVDRYVSLKKLGISTETLFAGQPNVHRDTIDTQRTRVIRLNLPPIDQRMDEVV